ncbi:MAG TPA: PKD domain-containing protein [Cytophagales bacterium]|nr:PKD domain-containing protein [Cytophagales bacterium]
MNNKLALLTFAIYTALAGIIYAVSSLSQERTIRASVYPRVITVDDKIVFADSTKGANQILWEFGNGSKSFKRKGAYKFQQPGTYIVRLTIDESQRDTFIVKVTQPAMVYKKDSSIFIYANGSGIVNQNIHFKAMGTEIEWCEWYFGESGKIDSRSHETFHSFTKPGEYQVKLITNLNPKKPVVHKISITAEYRVTEPIVIKPPAKGGGGGGPKDEFKERLQKIANGASFNEHFNYLVKKHLCSNSKVPVLVNGKSTADFYSYCQGLQINTGTKIDKVSTELNPKSGCVSKIIVVQH